MCVFGMVRVRFNVVLIFFVRIRGKGWLECLGG